MYVFLILYLIFFHCKEGQIYYQGQCIDSRCKKEADALFFTCLDKHKDQLWCFQMRDYYRDNCEFSLREKIK